MDQFGRMETVGSEIGGTVFNVEINALLPSNVFKLLRMYILHLHSPR